MSPMCGCTTTNAFFFTYVHYVLFYVMDGQLRCSPLFKSYDGHNRELTHATASLSTFFLRQPCYQFVDHFLLFIDENHKQNLSGKILTPSTHPIGILFLVTQQFIEEGPILLS